MFCVGIEPFGKSWTWDYYAYWNEMRGSPPRGQTWGNSFIHDPELKVEKGKWTCVELDKADSMPRAAAIGRPGIVGIDSILRIKFDLVYIL